MKVPVLLAEAQRTGELRADGVPEDALARVHCPVGLAIQAETPEEIAVAIAAEMVSVLRAGPGPGGD